MVNRSLRSNLYTLALVNTLRISTPGVAESNKALIVDSNKDLSGIRNLSVDNLNVSGTLLTATAAELNYVDTTPGIAEADKSLVVDANRDITNINNLTATNLFGTIKTASQPHITSLGTLSSLNINGSLNIIGHNGSTTGLRLNNTLVIATANEINKLSGLITNTSELNKISGLLINSTKLNYNDITTLGIAEEGKTLVLDSNKDISGIRNLTATNLTGTIQTSSQPNITSLGTLVSLTANGNVNIASHNGLNTGLFLNNNLVTSTATELNLLTNIQPGTVIANKVLAVDNNKDLLGLRNISIIGNLNVNDIYLDNSLILSTAEEINYLNAIVKGIASNNKALVLDNNKDLTGIRNLTIENLTISGSNFQLPSGNTLSRPNSPSLGLIRYNTETSQFEGYGAGNSWGSLGGVINVQQTTKILAENSPGSNDNNLRFINSNVETMRITSTGNIGINTNNPSYKLDISGTLRCTSSSIFQDTMTIYKTGSNNNSITSGLIIRNNYSSASSSGLGIGIDFWMPDSSGGQSYSGSLNCVVTNPITANFANKFEFKLYNAGIINTAASIDSTGLFTTNFINISSHNGSSTGLQLNGSLVTSTATELNYNDITTIGIAEASKTLVLNSSRNITNINNISVNNLALNNTTNYRTLIDCGSTSNDRIIGIFNDINSFYGIGVKDSLLKIQGGQSNGIAFYTNSSNTSTGTEQMRISSTTTNIINTLALNGISITATATEINYNDITTIGTAEASKSLVLDSNRDIVNIRNLTATNLTGTLQTANQPNITSVGTLTSLSTGDITLNGTLITATATELNILDGITVNTTKLNYNDITTIGTAEASKALILDANKDITNIRNLSATNLNSTNLTGTIQTSNQPNITSVGTLTSLSTGNITLNGTLITASSTDINKLTSMTTTTTELNYLSGITPGTTLVSKALVVDSNKDISGIRNLTANNLTGTVQTSNQPNITSLGTLTSLSTGDITLNGTLITATATELNYNDITAIGTAQASKTLILDSNRDIQAIRRLHLSNISIGTLDYSNLDRLISAIDNTLTNGNAKYLCLGKSYTTYNEAEWGYFHVSDGSTSNRQEFGFFGANGIFAITAGRKVGINKTNPSYDLDVNGSSNTTSLYLNGTLITATANEINYNDITTIGTAEASKSVILDSNKDISGIRNLTATNLTGTLQTSSQPNITSVGTLTSLSTGNITLNGTLITATATDINKLTSMTTNTTELNYLSGITIGTASANKSLIVDSNRDITNIRNLSSSRILLGTSIDTTSSRLISALDSTITTGNTRRQITLGKAASANNQIEIAFNWIADDSPLNYMSLGLHSNSSIINILGNGNVGIAHTSPNYKLDINGSLNSTSFYINGIQVTATANKINYNDITTIGTAESSKALILDSNRDITNIRNLTATTLIGTLQTASQPNITSVGTLTSLSTGNITLNGTLITATATDINKLTSMTTNTTELNYLSGLTPGTSLASKALIVDSNKDISGIRNLSATNLTGTIQTHTQPNIISLGTLISLSTGDITLNGTLITATATDINKLSNIIAGTASANKALILDLNKDISGINGVSLSYLVASNLNSAFRILPHTDNIVYLQAGLNTTADSAADLFIGNYGVATNASSRKIIFKADGKVGFGTASPNYHLDVVGSINGTFLYLNGTQITATATELNYNDITTIGIAEANKALIVDSNRDITNIRNLTATNLTGTLQTSSQPNITTIGTLTSLSTGNITLNGTLITSTAIDINKLSNITEGIVSASKAIIVDSNKDLTGIRNLTISGDLNISGTTTTINSTQINLKDNILQLNSGPSGSYDSGIIIQRYQPSNDNNLGDVIAETNKESYTASSVTINTIVLPSGANGNNNYYNGWWIKIQSATSGTNQIRQVLSYNGTNKTITISSNFTTTPTGTIVVNLYNKSFSNLIWQESNKRFVTGFTAQDTTAGTLTILDYADLATNELEILSTVDASSSSNGGSLTIAGGTAIAKKLFVGSDLSVSGNSTLTGILTVNNNVSFGNSSNSSSVISFNSANSNMRFYTHSDGICYIQAGISTTSGSAADLFIGNYNRQVNDSTRKFIIKADGKVGINTISPGYNLDVSGSINSTSLYINGSQITASAAELNYNDITTIGTAEASKALILDSSRNISNINSLSCTSLIVNGSAISASAAELNYLSGITVGTASANKAIVLDANKDINSINSLSANLITGTLQTASQPNITSVGTLTSLSTGNITLNGTLITATATEINYNDITTIGTAQASKALILDSNRDISNIRKVILNGLEDVLTISNNTSNTRTNIKFINDIKSWELGSRGSTYDRPNSFYLFDNEQSQFRLIIDGSGSVNIVSHNGSSTGLQLAGTLVTATAAELNILDGVTATTTELNYLDITTVGTGQSNKALILDSNRDISNIRNLTATNLTGTIQTANQPNITSLGTLTSLSTSNITLNGTLITSSASELNILDGVIATTAELNILNGISASTAELNILDGVIATTSDINALAGLTGGTVTANKALIVDSNKSLSGLNRIIFGANALNRIVSNSNEYRTLDGFNNTFTNNYTLTNGTDSSHGVSNYITQPTIAATNTNVTTTNFSTFYIHGEPINGTNMTITNKYALYINSGNSYLSGNVDIANHNGSSTGLRLNGTLITSTATEINKLSGLTSSTTELNKLTGATASTAEINTLSGVTAGTASASKVLVVNSNRDITNINSLTNNSLITNGTANINNITIGGNRTLATWGLVGPQFNATSNIYTDSSTAANGTNNAVMAINSFQKSTLAASNSNVTYQQAIANVYIANGPDAGTNATINSRCALLTGGAIGINPGTINISNWSSALIHINSGINTTVVNDTGSTNIAGIIGTNKFNAVQYSSNTAGRTMTRAATMYIINSPSAGTNMTITNSHALYIAAGNTTLADSTVSTNTTSGALVVTGGVGIGGSVNIGGTLSVTGNISGTIATASQPNITSVGTLTSLSTGNITLNGTLISATATELNKLSGTTAVTADFNKLATITSTATEINYNDLTTGPGTAEASKTVVLDSSRNINNINNISVNNIALGNSTNYRTLIDCGNVNGGTGLDRIISVLNDGTVFTGFGAKDNLFKIQTGASNGIAFYTGSNNTSVGTEQVRINSSTTNIINTLALNGTSISATASEINKLSGLTSSTTELNKLTGLTSSTTELNKLTGLTSSATELNYLSGITIGQGAINKAVVLDSNRDINNINVLYSNTLQASNQIIATNANGWFRIIPHSDNVIYLQAGLTSSSLNGGSAADLFIGNAGNDMAGSSRKIMFKSDGKVGFGLTNPSYTLDISGDINITGNYRTNGSIINLSSITGITNGTAAASKALILDSSSNLISGINNFSIGGTLTVGTVGSSNRINFSGTSGDPTTNMTVIAERIYGGIEASELILFKGNDPLNGSGPERIRLRAAEIKFQTYTTVEDYSGLSDNNDRLFIANDGKIGINTSSPNHQLDVSGDINLSGSLRLSGTAITATAIELNKLSGVTATTNDINTLANITAGTVSASKAIIVDSNKDLTGLRNLTISGDLIVSGTTTTINSTQINLKDNILQLNSGPAGTYDAGIIIQRYQTSNDSNLGDIISETYKETYTASSVTINTIVLPSGANANNNYYNGWWIKIQSATTGANQVRQVLSYNGTNKTITISSNFTITPTGTIAVNLYNKSFSNLIWQESNKRFITGFTALDATAGTITVLDYADLATNNLNILSTTDAISSSNGGSLTIAGGVAIAKKLFIGTDLSVSGNSTLTGTLSVTGNITGTLATSSQPNITSVGNLTIPASLTITNGSSPLSLSNTTSSSTFICTIQNSGGAIDIGSSTNHDLHLRTNNTRRITISNTGNVNIVNHNGSTTGLQLNGTLVTATATKLNYTDIANIGTAEASKAIILDSSSNLNSGINNFSIGGILTVGTSSAGPNRINFKGVTGDTSDEYTVIAERLYSGSDKAELLLFKGNDTGGVAGPDRIRLRSGEIRFQTNTVAENYSGTDGNATAGDNNNRMIITNDGKVGINTVSPGYQLDVNGSLNSTSFYLNSIQITASADELNYNDITSIGIGQASKALILDSSRNINNINTLSTTGVISNVIGNNTTSNINYQTWTNDLTTDIITSLQMNNVGMDFGTSSNHPIGLITNNIERLTITNSGIVNITNTTNSTSSSTGALTVAGGIGLNGDLYTTGLVRTSVLGQGFIHNDGTINLVSWVNNSSVADNAYFGTTTNHHLNLQTNNTSRVFISNTGNVSIGSTDNTYKLQVSGDINLTGSLRFNGTAITASVSELNVLSGITATVTELNYNDITTIGTAQASKALIVDSNKDIQSIRRLHLSNISIGTLDYTNTNRLISAIDNTITNGSNRYLCLGKNYSNNNEAEWGYFHVSDGSTSNRQEFGFAGSNGIFAITAGRKVGINNTSPSYDLDITGDLNLTNTLKIGATTIIDSSKNISNINTFSSFGLISNIIANNTATNINYQTWTNDLTTDIISALQINNVGMDFGTTSNHPIGLITNNTERLTITNGGIVNITNTTASTNSTTGALTVAGGIGSNGNINAAQIIKAGINNVSYTAIGTSGAYFQTGNSTITNSGAAINSTIATTVFSSFARPTLAASNTGVTTTNAATIYIENEPLNGTNMSLSNSYALWVNSGKVLLGSGFGDTNKSIATLTINADTLNTNAEGAAHGLLISGGNTIANTCLYMGADNTNGVGYIQSSKIGAHMPIALNPRGGNVGVGLINPGYKLDISGDLNVSGNYRSAGSIVDFSVIAGVTLGTISGSKSVTVDSNSNINSILRLKKNANNQQIYFENGTSTGTIYHDLNGSIYLGTISANNLIFQTQNINRVTITSAGLMNIQGGWQISGTTVTATADELNYVDVSAGTGTASKALVLDTNRDINNIRRISTTNISLNNATTYPTVLHCGSTSGNKIIGVYNNSTTFYGFGALDNQLKLQTDQSFGFYTSSTGANLGDEKMRITATSTSILQTTSSTSSSTGALIVSGGIGCAESVNIAGSLIVNDISTIFGTLNLSSLNANNTTSYDIYQTWSNPTTNMVECDIYINNTDVKFGTSTNHTLKLITNNNDQLTITNTGNVGIGTTSPSYKLDISGDINISGNYRSAGSIVSISAIVGVTSGTASASKALILDSSSNLNSGINNFNISGALTVGTVGSGPNRINFSGTSGDPNNNHTVLAERIYNSTEQSELLIFKGNDPVSGSGPDRIRLRAAEIRFQTTYNATDAAEVYSDLKDDNTRLFIGYNGKIGINTTSPQGFLDFGGTASNYIINLWQNGTNVYGFGANDDAVKYLTAGANGHIWYTGSTLTNTGTERMRITTSGNITINGGASIGTSSFPNLINYASGGTVLIGTNTNVSSSHWLEVKGAKTSALIRGTNDVFIPTSSWPSGWDGGLVTNDILCASVSYAGLLNRSDRRLKKDIEDYTRGLNELIQLRTVKYKWIDEHIRSDEEHYGFIAQELELIIPEMVSESENGYKNIKSEYTPLLVNSIKELNNKIESQKNIIENLENENQQLKDQIQTQNNLISDILLRLQNLENTNL